jgi:hypothetical protein
MATVNLNWNIPSPVPSDWSNIEVYRFANQQSANTAALTTLIASATPEATLATSATSWDDTSAPTGALTYCVVSSNSAGSKLEDGGHADETIS